MRGAPRETRWRQVQIPSSAFFELCFCLYLSGTEKTQKQTIKERQNKTQNEGERFIWSRLSQRGCLCPHPLGNPFLGYFVQVRKWHASQLRIYSKLFLHAAEDCSQKQKRERAIIGRWGKMICPIDVPRFLNNLAQGMWRKDSWRYIAKELSYMWGEQNRVPPIPWALRDTNQWPEHMMANDVWRITLPCLLLSQT